MVRLAQPTEADAVRDLVREAYQHYVARLGREPGPMRGDDQRRITDGQVWVLDVEGQIMGVVVLKERPDGFLLDNIVVAPSAQGQGYGRQLIAFAEEEARRRGYDEIRLYTNELMTENIALYQRLGYVEIRRIDEDGYHRVPWRSG
jgi:ribosomal protein S18 acetylase RimI-like enzyme